MKIIVIGNHRLAAEAIVKGRGMASSDVECPRSGDFPDLGTRAVSRPEFGHPSGGDAN